MIKIVFFITMLVFHFLLMQIKLSDEICDLKGTSDSTAILKLKFMKLKSLTSSRFEGQRPTQNKKEVKKTLDLDQSAETINQEKKLINQESNRQAQMIPPEYPREARRKKQSGQVIVEYQIDQTGLVGHKKIIKSSGYHLLDEAALESIENNKHILLKLVKDVITFNFSLKM